MKNKIRNRIDEAAWFLQQNDPIFKKTINEIGACTLSPSEDYFGSLIKSVIYQQLSNKTARTIYERFLHQVGNELTPDNVLKVSDDQYRIAGISTLKQGFITGLANTFKNGEIGVENFCSMDNEEIIKQLIKLRGIGRWSAEMFLIFCLNRLDVLPLDDIGFKKSLIINYMTNSTTSWTVQIT